MGMHLVDALIEILESDPAYTPFKLPAALGRLKTIQVASRVLAQIQLHKERALKPHIRARSRRGQFEWHSGVQ